MNTQEVAIIVGLVLAACIAYAVGRFSRRYNAPRNEGMATKQALTRPVVLIILAAIIVLFVVSSFLK